MKIDELRGLLLDFLNHAHGVGEVTRLCHVRGHVVLMIQAPRQEMQVRITPTGLIRPDGVRKREADRG